MEIKNKLKDVKDKTRKMQEEKAAEVIFPSSLPFFFNYERALNKNIILRLKDKWRDGKTNKEMTNREN